MRLLISGSRLITVMAILLGTLVSCSTVKPYYGDKAYQIPPEPSIRPVSQIILVGDAGDMKKEDPIRPYIRKFLAEPSAQSGALVFLGDNIYTFGLPEPSAPDYDEKVSILTNQMTLAEDYDGKVIFIPGNHDWNKSREGGWEAIRRQEEIVNSFYGETSFMPSGGCPGPVAVSLENNLVLIVIDSEWWLHKNNKPAEPDCQPGTPEGVAAELTRLVNENYGKRIIIAAHHPIVSNGEHGGYYGVADHVFPLRNLKPWLYFPLPVLGSIYPLSRHYGVSSQDIPNRDFQTYRQMLLTSMGVNSGIIYVSGHEHNLQFHELPGFYQLISGAGSKTNYARKRKEASYVQQQIGFARLLFFADGQGIVEFYVINKKSTDLVLTYRQNLFNSSQK